MGSIEGSTIWQWHLMNKALGLSLGMMNFRQNVKGLKNEIWLNNSGLHQRAKEQLARQYLA